MSSDLGHWDRVASELRACREAQQQAWGDIDNATLGRYLAGHVTPEERRRIESALETLPELRKLTDLVSDVLRDCEPVAGPVAARPAVLPFRPAAPAVRTKARRWPRWAAIAAAACLLLALGYAVLPRNGFRLAAPHGGAPMQPMAVDLTIKDAGAPPPPAHFFRNSDEKNLPAVDAVVLAADGLARAGSAYEKKGDLDLAEFSYKLAYNMQEWRLGPDARPTVQTRRNLGAVYQTALAMEDEVAADKTPTPPLTPAAPNDDERLQTQVRRSAALLRGRIAKQAVRDVRTSVVPALVQNLREAQTPQAREQLGRALAQLGPAAKDAVPALEECLRKAETPQESAVMLYALGEAGPSAAPTAAPVLVTSLKSPSPEVRRAAEDALSNYGPAARDEMLKMADGAAADRPEWRSLRERLNGVEGRIGVRDGCEVLSLQALRQGQKEIRELARTRRVGVYAETRPAPAKDEEAKADMDRARDVDANCVYLVIHPSPLNVVVHVGQALRDEGLDVARLRQAVEDASRQDFDEGLLAGVRFVERFEAEKAKKTPSDAPPAKPE